VIKISISLICPILNKREELNLEKSSVIEDNLGGYRFADNMDLITELIFKDHIS